MTTAISSFLPSSLPAAPPMPPARSKYSCKEYIALTGTVLAVAGLASAFFIGANVLMAVFGVFTLVMATSFYSIRQLSSLADLARTSDALIKTQNAFVAIQREMERLNLELDVDRAELTASNSNLRNTTDALARSNLNLQNMEQEVQATIAQVTQENTQLQTTNLQLKREIGDLELAMKQVHNQVEAFTTLNVQFGQNEGFFRKDIEALNVETLELDQSSVKFDQAIHANVQNLAEQIQLGQAVTFKSFDALKAQNKELQTEIKQLADLISKGSLSQKHLDELVALAKKKDGEVREAQDRLRVLEQQSIAAAINITRQEEALGEVQRKLHEDIERAAPLQEELHKLVQAKLEENKGLKNENDLLKKSLHAACAELEKIKASEIAARKH